MAAGHIRLRPILMTTTAAMVFGMLPMAAALQVRADGPYWAADHRRC